MRSGKAGITAIAFTALFLAGAAGGYFYFKLSRQAEVKQSQGQLTPVAEEFTDLKVYFPYENKLIMEQRRIGRAMSKREIARESLKEFLKGASSVVSDRVPDGVDILGVYPGSDGILYIDVSDRFRSGFQGNAQTEFLLVRALYETMATNVYGISGLKILVGGKEIESIGGHISVSGALKDFAYLSSLKGNEQ